MQAENTKNNIKVLSFGCRLNALECEKVAAMLAPHIPVAVLVNTCSVTAEAERQCGQAVRKIARENPNVPIFVTGCAATRNPELFTKIPGAIVIKNSDKMNPDAYMATIKTVQNAKIEHFVHDGPNLSKQFIRVQSGCNHECTFCITRLLRGPSVSVPYDEILADVRAAIHNGFYEIVLTGVDTASYVQRQDGKNMFISDLCRKLLADVPGIKRFRLSSLDPASPEVIKIIDLIKAEPRMMPHLHLSMQSGSDNILRAMRRRHTSEMVRHLAEVAGPNITFSWDIICGFPGETDAEFKETMRLAWETRPIRIHAFPYSPRPGTVAATLPDQVDRHIAKLRVKEITQLAKQNLNEFMRPQIGKTVQVLVEEDNIARDPHDINVKILGAPITPRAICDVKITGIRGDEFIAEI